MAFFLTFILPALLTGGIGLLLGLLLAYCGQKFKVETDPRVEEVSKLLAGVNCGACGYAGCAAFAEALCLGTAKLEACRPTKQDSKEKIAAVLSGGVKSAPEKQGG
jgi:RnfABCDGE-type electron transport complex B subunit